MWLIGSPCPLRPSPPINSATDCCMPNCLRNIIPLRMISLCTPTTHSASPRGSIRSSPRRTYASSLCHLVAAWVRLCHVPVSGERPQQRISLREVDRARLQCPAARRYMHPAEWATCTRSSGLYLHRPSYLLRTALPPQALPSVYGALPPAHSQLTCR